VTVCEAIQHAHDIGIVHGDPKPSTVLIDDKGKPWLFDWGMSRVIDPEQLKQVTNEWLESTSQQVRTILLKQMTTGVVAGTPVFMSPEQARGEGVDRQTDVYVLGATLFHLLTGRPPYSTEMLHNEPFAKVFEKIGSAQFPAPRSLDRAIPRKLERICLKAMAAHREDRYHRASDIADAVGSWLGR
jgi:eukaryotic-like serine/threonine-protein kinase